MAEENLDIFGNPIMEEDDDPIDDPVEDNVEDNDDAPSDEEPDDDTPTDEDVGETLQGQGDEPIDGNDLESVRKYWRSAYTQSRQKDRAKYSKMEGEHQQYQQLLANFYQDDNYAMQVIRQRFPNLANQMSQSGQGQQTTQAGNNSDLTQQLQQSLGEFGFLAEQLGPALDRFVEARVNERVGPIEQRATQQTAAQRKDKEQELLAAMDGKFPGWEDRYGTEMEELDRFLASDALTHPKFGSKYELYFKLVNPDAARADAIKAMAGAAKRRTGFSRSGRNSVPNIDEQVRKAESSSDAFRLAAKLASEELG
jgi:hypothetical protein